MIYDYRKAAESNKQSAMYILLVMARGMPEGLYRWQNSIPILSALSKFSEPQIYIKKSHTSANWNKADAWHCFEGTSGWDVLEDIWKETCNF